MVDHSGQYVAQEEYYFLGEGVGGILRLIKVNEEGHKAAHVVKRYHGSTITHQSIVSIIPLWTQGVHPYTCFWNEIAEFGKQCDENLLGEGHQQRLVVGTHQQTGILSVGRKKREDSIVGQLVECDSVFRITYDVRIGAETIRDCCKSKLTHA